MATYWWDRFRPILGLAAEWQPLVEKQTFGDISASNYSEFETDGTLKFNGDATVWDDIRIIPAGFDRPGVADPALVLIRAGIYGWEFQVDDSAYFSVQMPHNYKVGSNFYVHVHWTPGANGVAESGKAVGWKVDLSVASIGSAIGATSLYDLSDTVTGTNYLHEVASDVVVSGTGVGISAMLMGTIKRTDTGADDTWAGVASGSLPILLELDFHYEIDTVGSRERTSK
jgi:hypothetical protein